MTNCAVCFAGMLEQENVGRCAGCRSLICEACSGEKYCAACMVKREEAGTLLAWDTPPSWDDARRWVPTDDHGTRPGDIAGRLVAVSNGRWFALPFLRSGECFDFIQALFTFAERYGIRLTVWRHPLSGVDGFAELIGSSEPVPHRGRLAA